MGNIDKYIELAFNPTSPLLEKYRDDPEGLRKAALNLAGLDDESIISSQNKEVNDKIVAYLREFNSPLWGLIVSNMNAFMEFQFLLAKPIDSEMDDKKILESAEKKSKLLIEMDTILERLKKYLDRFFGEHHDLHNEGQIKLTPETMQNLRKS